MKSSHFCVRIKNSGKIRRNSNILSSLSLFLWGLIFLFLIWWIFWKSAEKVLFKNTYGSKLNGCKFRHMKQLVIFVFNLKALSSGATNFMWFFCLKTLAMSINAVSWLFENALHSIICIWLHLEEPKQLQFKSSMVLLISNNSKWGQ